MTVRTSALRLVLWKRLTKNGRQFAITGLMAFGFAAAALPAQAAAYTQNPPGIQLLRATRTAVWLGWSAPSGAMSYTYRLYQMNGVQVQSGCEPGSYQMVICRGLHPGWRYRAELWASPGSSPHATLYVRLPGLNPPRELAYQWAETQAGTRYQYGGQGNGGYDCSGLVRAAYLRAGIWLPRTTGEMLQYWRLDQESSPRQGDLVFFGSGHIELYAGRDQSFGAENNRTGTWWNRWWPGDWWPTAFYRVSGAD